MTFYEKKCDMKHLQLLYEKSEESRPPLKLKNNGGLPRVHDTDY